MREMTFIFASVIAAAGLVSCGEPWEGAVGRGTATLTGFRITRGGHCESSAILNALLNQGYAVTEPMITGAGGAIGFGFEKGAFPFISARNPDMREIFFEAAGIPWYKAIPEAGGDSGWREIRSLIERGIPVVLRVDMRFLPYRYGGKYGPKHMSFGWHMITLYGIDADAGTAMVSDTEFAEGRSIKLADLHRARTSTTKVFPPRAEYSWAEPAPAGWKPDWARLFRASARTMLRNYEEGSLAALEGFPADLESFESWCKPAFLHPAVLEYMAGNIEDFGTGGASFRILYRDFLALARAAGAPVPEGFSYEEAISAAEGCISSWHELSGAFRAASKSIKKMQKEDRARTWAEFSEIARRLSEREKAFYNEMKRYATGE